MSGVTAYPACGACHQAPKVSLPPFACPFEGRAQVVADADGGRVRPPGAGHDSQLRPHTVPRLRATSSGCAQVCGNERQPGACRVPGMHGGGHSTQPQMLRPADRHRQPRAPAHDGDDAGATMLPNAASPSAVVRGLFVLLRVTPSPANGAFLCESRRPAVHCRRLLNRCIRAPRPPPRACPSPVIPGAPRLRTARVEADISPTGEARPPKLPTTVLSSLAVTPK